MFYGGVGDDGMQGGFLTQRNPRGALGPAKSCQPADEACACPGVRMVTLHSNKGQPMGPQATKSTATRVGK